MTYLLASDAGSPHPVDERGRVATLARAEAVHAAREADYAWTDIGMTLRITRQTAQTRSRERDHA